MENINKNIIMQAGAAVANATNKAAGLTASTPEPGSIISAIQLVNGGRTIGPDALAHFTESVRNKLLSLLVDMYPIQDFNGYDHPWPAGGGKNLCYADASNLFPRGDGLTIVENAGTYTAYAKVSKNTDYVFSCATAPFRSSLFGFESEPAVGVIAHSLNYTTPTATSRTFNSGNYEWVGFYYGAPEHPQTNVMIEAGTSPTDYAPYSNICPISGRTGLHVYAGPTSAIGDAATYSMTWTSPAGTVYAGSADIVTGDIKAAPYYASYNGETLVGPWVSSMDEYDPEGTPTTGAQVVDLGGTMTEYHITGQDIITLVGDNYIWSDSGDVTITE